MRIHKIFWVAAVIAAALPWSAVGQTDQESLGDVARQARQQRQKAPKPGKVYTNDDIPAVAPMPTPPPEPASGKTAEGATANDSATKPASPEAAQEQPAPEAKAPEPAVKDRGYWLAKFKVAREALAKAKEEQQLAEDELNLLQVQEAREFGAAATFDTAAKDELDQKIRGKQAEVEAKKTATETAQKALDDLENGFRDSGAPEDWSVTESAPTPKYGPRPIEPAAPPSPDNGGQPLQ